MDKGPERLPLRIAGAVGIASLKLSPFAKAAGKKMVGVTGFEPVTSCM
jgi:hypothetical protein